MDAKLLLLIALLAPILTLAAGIFARREDAGDNTENGHPELRRRMRTLGV
jgi:hypothetical protein